MLVERLRNHKYANVGYYCEDSFDTELGWVTERGMLSYRTKVIIIRKGRVIFTGRYSRTPSRQLSWWMIEHACVLKGLTIKDLDDMFAKEIAYNLKTKSFEPLTETEKMEIKEIRRKAFNYRYGW